MRRADLGDACRSQVQSSYVEPGYTEPCHNKQQQAKQQADALLEGLINRVTRNDSRATATSQHVCRNVLVRGVAMSPQGHGHMRRQCLATLPLRLFDLQLMTKQHASPEPSHNHSSSSLCGPLDNSFRAKAKLGLSPRQRKKRQERRIQTTIISAIKGCAYRV